MNVLPIFVRTRPIGTLDPIPMPLTDEQREAVVRKVAELAHEKIMPIVIYSQDKLTITFELEMKDFA